MAARFSRDKIICLNQVFLTRIGSVVVSSRAQESARREGSHYGEAPPSKDPHRADQPLAQFSRFQAGKKERVGESDPPIYGAQLFRSPFIALPSHPRTTGLLFVCKLRTAPRYRLKFRFGMYARCKKKVASAAASKRINVN